MVNVRTNCKWCDREVRCSALAAILPFLAPKHCGDSCRRAEETCAVVVKMFAEHFQKKIWGESLGSVKCYPSYFEEMLTWPSWSPKGEALRLEAQKDQPPAP
jgi:hypothetical protein